MMLTRRKAILGIGQGVVAATVTAAIHSRWGSLVRAAPADRRFLLYIHCGSWDGLASGLLQPNPNGVWPSGCFVPGQTAEPINPYMKQITQEGSHYFHYYSKVLKELKAHLFQATAAPESLDHNVAFNIASQGAPSANPSWNAGFAQATRPQSKSVVNVVGGRPSFTTPQVAFANASTLNDFRSKFSEATSVPVSQMTVEGRAAFMNVSAQMYQQHYGGSAVPVAFQSNLTSSANGWINGIPELAATSPAIISLIETMSKTKTDKLITSYYGGGEAENIRVHNGGNESLRQQLILAAALAESGYANGMNITLPQEDLHAGGSGVITARSGAQLWVMLAQFWEWIKLQNLQNQVLVVVSHDFSRTPYNNNFSTQTIRLENNVISLNVPGTDHGLAAGVVALHGRIHPSRLGGIRGSTAGSYFAGGANSLGGSINNDPAPTRQQIIGSLLMRAFPGEFIRPGQETSGRLIKAIWPNFDAEKDVIGALL